MESIPTPAPSSGATAAPPERVHIVSTPDTCGGKPRIAGSRIQVEHLAVMHERQGMSPEDIVAEFPHLTLADVYAALAYYHDHREAINAEIAADRTNMKANTRTGQDEKVRTSEAAILDRIIQPGKPTFSPAAAGDILALDFDQADKERMRELLAKAQEGTLTPDEQAAMNNYELVGHLINILQSKARRSLKGNRGPRRKVRAQ